MHKNTSRDEITPKTPKTNYSQNAKEEIVSGMGENAAIWGIYSLCGVPVRKVH
jgi:hypothetical protein